MTKYMKVTDPSNREVYIDLYKINSIRESFTELRDIYVPNELGTGYGGHRHLANHTNDQGYFRTLFSVPGDSAMTVGGSAQEFIDHIEEQQKRARKGKEIEPYNPKWWTVYTENGKVHPINELLEPVGFRSGRSESRAINIQVAKYINQIEEIGQAEGMSYSPCPEAFSGKVLDLLSEAQDKLSVGNLRLLHKTVNSIAMKAMKHSQSANDTASISTGM
tara:strand:+ start:225 stop:881 length:657 start_codon:yes stop_codon:yes gene_type:complete